MASIAAERAAYQRRPSQIALTKATKQLSKRRSNFDKIPQAEVPELRRLIDEEREQLSKATKDADNSGACRGDNMEELVEVCKTLDHKRAIEPLTGNSLINSMQKAQPIGHRMRRQPSEKLTLITKDLIRTLPLRDPNEKQGNRNVCALSESEWNNIMKNAKPVEQKDTVEKVQDQITAFRQQEQICSEHKAIFHFHDQMRQQEQLGDKDDELSQEMSKRIEQMRAIGRTAKMENADEIKYLNNLITYGKMKQIRDLQVEDTKVKNQMTTEEEKRLDAVMQYDNDLSLDLQRQLEKAKHEQQNAYASQLRQQIDARNQYRALEGERRQREAKETVDRWKYVNERDMAGLRYKKDKQRQLRQDILRDIADKRVLIEQRKQLEKAYDKEILEQQAQKLRDKELYEEAENKKKKAREMEGELAQLAVQRAHEREGADDELRIQRNVFLAEREWRRQELAKKVEKRQQLEEMNRTREWQHRDRLETMAQQARRDRDEFNRMFNALSEEQARDAANDAAKHNEAVAFGQALRKQITLREDERIQKRRKFLQEGGADRQVNDERDMELQEYAIKKLMTANKDGLDVGFCRDIMRHLVNHKLLPHGMKEPPWPNSKHWDAHNSRLEEAKGLDPIAGKNWSFPRNKY